MDIRNWEFYDSGAALVGATVNVRDAILTHPNANTILATGSTDSNGAWAFTGLTDTAKDVEVIWGNVGQYHKWYKGLTRHDTGVIFFEEPQEFKQVASLGTAAGAGSSILGFKTDGEPIFRSGAAGAETKIATFTGATGVLKAGGWGTIGSAEITDDSIVNADVNSAAAIAYSKLALANSIVTGDIVNGTIATADLANNAATQPISVVDLNGGSTTSVAATWATLGSISGTFGGGRVYVIAQMIATLTISNLIYFGYNLDGGGDTQFGLDTYVAGAYKMSTMYADLGALSGAHTVNVRWMIGAAGTANTYAGSKVSLLEFKK